MLSKLKFVLRKDFKNSKGLHSVRLRITINRSVSYVGSGIELMEKDWNDKTGEVRRNNPFFIELNNRLKVLFNVVQLCEIDLINEKIKISPSILAERVKQHLSKSKNGVTIREFLENELIGRTFHDSRNVKSALNIALNYFGENSTFQDLTYSDLTNFVKFQLSIGKSTETVKKYINKLRLLYNRAENEKLISIVENPFNRKPFELPFPKSQRAKDVKLEISELKLLIEYKPLSDLEQFVKDIFLFQVYAQGIRISDALSLKHENIKGNVLTYQAHKTKKDFEILLSERELNLIEKYKGKNKTEFLFPFLRKTKKSNLDSAIMAKTTLINKTLKRIAAGAGIDPELSKKLSSHAARHTFAYLVSEKAPLHYVQSMLGHSDIQQTRDYIGSLRPEKLSDYRNIIFDEIDKE